MLSRDSGSLPLPLPDIYKKYFKDILKAIKHKKATLLSYYWVLLHMTMTQDHPDGILSQDTSTAPVLRLWGDKGHFGSLELRGSGPLLM